ncbi:MAG: FkbM family methyltransferase [Gammaproteobacteria bacterium]
MQKTLIRWHTRPALTEKTALRDFMRALHPRMPGMELIRMGPRGDGGYLVPDDLGGVAACFSPGVAEESGFELDCANAGMQVFMADASVAKPAAAHGNFHFVRKNIGAFNAEECMTIDRWAEDSLPDSAAELILQMDIEGGEYEVFLSMSEPLMKRFRIIAAEFHALHCLYHRPFFSIASRAFAKILQTHECVHIHPNNVSRKKYTTDIPPLMEFTFLRRDRMRGEGKFARNFPHSLDCDNVPARPPLPLPPCWRGAAD